MVYSMLTGKIDIFIKNKTFKTKATGRKKVMYVLSSESEDSGSIFAMNTCHPGKPNDNLLQVLKINGISEAQENSVCLTWSKTYIPGTLHTNKNENKNSQEFCFNPSTWDTESRGSVSLRPFWGPLGGQR